MYDNLLIFIYLYLYINLLIIEHTNLAIMGIEVMHKSQAKDFVILHFEYIFASVLKSISAKLLCLSLTTWGNKCENIWADFPPRFTGLYRNDS